MKNDRPLTIRFSDTAYDQLAEQANSLATPVAVLARQIIVKSLKGEKANV